MLDADRMPDEEIDLATQKIMSRPEGVLYAKDELRVAVTAAEDRIWDKAYAAGFEVGQGPIIIHGPFGPI